jgi:hypothetical protein
MHNNFVGLKNLMKIKQELNLKGHYFVGIKNIFNI